ncbi:MAG: hypothetical protein V7750_00750 [Sneathiella sp.]
MADEENKEAAESDMPSPPDLTSIYEEQKTKLEVAYKASSAAFDVFKARDAALSELTTAYNEEIIKVFEIAKKVTSPPTALVSVPLVLAAANEALAKATATDLAITSAIEAAFSEFKP